MKINKILIVLALATVYYVLWQIGFDYIWANVLKAGISTITATLAGIQQVTIDNTSPVPVLYFKYADRTNHVNIEYALPIVLMLAWQTYLCIVKEVPR